TRDRGVAKTPVLSTAGAALTFRGISLVLLNGKAGVRTRRLEIRGWGVWLDDRTSSVRSVAPHFLGRHRHMPCAVSFSISRGLVMICSTRSFFTGTKGLLRSYQNRWERHTKWTDLEGPHTSLARGSVSKASKRCGDLTRPRALFRSA